MNLRSRLGKRFRAELAGRIAGILSSTLLMIVLARLLDPDGYGLLFLAISVLGTIELCSKLGIATSTGRYISEYKEMAPGQLHHILRFAVGLNLATIALSCLALLVFYDRIASYVGSPGIAPLLLVGTLFVALETMNTLLRKIFQGFEDIETAAIVKTVNHGIKLPVAVGLVLLGYGTVGALVGYTVGLGAAVAVGSVVVYWRYYRTTDRSPLEAGLRRRIAEYSIPVTVTDTAHVIDKRFDTILVGFFLGPAAVGFYTVAKQIVDSAQMPMAALGFTLSPTYESQKVQGNAETAARIYETALSNGLLLYVPAATGLILVADPFVELIFGPDYTAAVPVLQVFAIYAVLLSVTKVTSNGLDFLGRARERAIVKGVTAVCNVALNIVLIPWLGVVGAAVATVITYSIYTVANVYLITLEFDIRVRWLARHLAAVLAVTAVMAAVVSAVVGYVGGIVSLVAVIGVGGGVWALLVTASGLLDVRTIVADLT